MKKILILALALIMILALAACGNGKVSVKDLGFETAAADAEPEGFLVVVGKDGTYNWQIGLDTFEDIYTNLSITPDAASYVNVYIASVSEQKYPYLYPEDGWKAYVAADSDASLLTDTLKKGVASAFSEWKDDVYALFDYKTIREATPDWVIANAPGEGYEVTQEDIDMFLAYPENSVNRDMVQEIIAKQLGASVGGDAYNYLKVKVADKLKNTADVGTLLKGMGITNTGGTQEGFGAGIIATYFTFDTEEWHNYDSAIELMNQFLAKGMTFSNASDNMNRLHSYKDGIILYEASTNDMGKDNAFAAVVTKDGTVYWKTGVDNCETLRTINDISGSDYIDLQVMPVLKDGATEEYVLPDGLNPEVMRHFLFFEGDGAVEWTLFTRLDAPFPDWFTDAMRSDVMDAFEEWHAEVLKHIDLDTALSIFPESKQNVNSYTDADVALLKEWVTIVNDLKEKGTSVGQVISASLNDTVGSTLVSEMGAWANAKWRLIHTDCSAPCIKIGYLAFYEVVDTDAKISCDVESVASASVFKDIDWTYDSGNGGYPFQPLADLTNKGYICYTDGDYWYLTAGPDCTVLLRITEADLLK